MDEEMPTEAREEQSQAVFSEAQPMFSMPPSSSSLPHTDPEADAQEMDIASNDVTQTEQGDMTHVEPPTHTPVSQTEIPV